MKRIHSPILAMALLLMACHSNDKLSQENTVMDKVESDSVDNIAPQGATAVQAAYQEQSPAPKPTTQKIIKTARLRYEVENAGAHKAYIKEAAKKWNAQISSSTVQNNSYALVLRVPSEAMEALTAALLSQAVYLIEKNVQARDVGEEFVDLQARLKNKRAVEAQYREILKKAKKIEDILLVEDKIRVITEEIEAKQGRLNYLMNQVALSTIYIDFYQQRTEVGKGPGKSFIAKLGEGFVGGWEVLLSLIIGLSYLWPLLVLAIGTAWAVKKFWRRKSKTA